MSEAFGQGRKQDGLAFKDKFEGQAEPPPSTLPAGGAPDRDLLLTPGATAPVRSAVMAAPLPADLVDQDIECLSPDIEAAARSKVTIAQHLERGRHLTDRRQQAANARTQRLADKRMEHWLNLTDAVCMVVGEELMTKCTLPQPDTTFTFDTEKVTLTFRPFNRSTFDCVFQCSLRKLADEGREYDTPWSLVKGPGHKPFSVHQDWRASSEGTKPQTDTRVYTVSEAVHLTYLQSDGYDDALKRANEMKRRDAEEVSNR